MRTVGPRRGHRRSIRPAAVGATCLALLAGSLVAAVGVAGPAEAATIPTNPCVASPGPVSTTRPVLTAVSMSTSTLDVRRRAKKLVVTVRAHDTVALNLVRVRITQWPPKRFAMGVDAHLVAGTAIDGTWRAVVTVPKGVPDGRYRLSTLSLSDTGNGWLTAVPSSAAVRRLAGAVPGALPHRPDGPHRHRVPSVGACCRHADRAGHDPPACGRA